MPKGRASRRPPTDEEVLSRYVRESCPSPRSVMSSLSSMGFSQQHVSHGSWEKSHTYDGIPVETKIEFRIYTKSGSKPKDKWKALEDGVVTSYGIGFQWVQVRTESGKEVTGTVDELRLVIESPIGGTKERIISTDRDWKQTIHDLPWKERWVSEGKMR